MTTTTKTKAFNKVLLLQTLKKELKEWKSQEVKERFEKIYSQLHLITISELQYKIKILKSGQDI
jgi:hypothetical protein